MTGSERLVKNEMEKTLKVVDPDFRVVLLSGKNWADRLWIVSCGPCRWTFKSFFTMQQAVRTCINEAGVDCVEDFAFIMRDMGY